MCVCVCVCVCVSVNELFKRRGRGVCPWQRCRESRRIALLVYIYITELSVCVCVCVCVCLSVTELFKRRGRGVALATHAVAESRRRVGYLP